MPAAFHRYGLYFGVAVLEYNFLHRSLLDAVAVHVDSVKDTFREILLHWSRELGREEVQKD